MGGTYESRSAALTAPEPAPAEREERPQLTVKFSNPEVEKRWAKASEGMRGTMTMKERVTEWLTYVAAGFTRHFVHLPNDPLYSDLREQLRKLEAAPQASKETRSEEHTSELQSQMG